MVIDNFVNIFKSIELYVEEKPNKCVLQMLVNCYVNSVNLFDGIIPSRLYTYYFCLLYIRYFSSIYLI